MGYMEGRSISRTTPQHKQKLPMSIIFISLLLLMPQVTAQQAFVVPDSSTRVDVDYLRTMKVSDTTRQLNEAARRDLCRLFIRAYVFSIRQRRQDYSLSSDTPIYRLLASNLPEVKARESEGGRLIFLGAIAGFFNGNPEYRDEVINILKNDAPQGHCK